MTVNYCDLQKNIRHLGEVSESRKGGLPSGEPIDTSTSEVTGDVRDTLDGRFKKMQSQFDKRFQTAQPLEWKSGDLVSNGLQAYSNITNNNKTIYFPNPELLPFTTSATFEQDYGLNRFIEIELVVRGDFKFSHQINFVEQLRFFKPFKNQLTVTSQENINLLSLYPSGNYIQHYFVKENGDYITQGSTYAGKWTEDIKNEDGITLGTGIYTGAWTAPTDSASAYTRTVNDSFSIDYTQDVDGADILIRTYVRNDGGNIKVSITEKADPSTILAEKVISGYSEATGRKVTKLMSGSKKDVAYTITATYIGGGERGWLLNAKENFVLRGDIFYKVSTQELIKSPSNLDYAIEFAPNTNPTDFEFMPAHSGVKTDYLASPRKFLIDGKSVDVSSLANGHVQSCDDFQFIQHVYARHPSTGDTNHAEVIGIQGVNEWGELVMNGYMKPYPTMIYGNGYTMMHMTKVEIASEAISGIGNRYPISVPAEQTNIPMIEEGDKCLNFNFVSKTTGSAVDNVLSAMTIDNPLKTRKTGKDKGSYGELTYLQLRTASICKIYSQLFTKPDSSGEITSWSGRYKYVSDDLVPLFVENFRV